MASNVRVQTVNVCNCWVSRALEEEIRFGARYGAHGEKCPLYHASRDPVDRVHDGLQRQWGEEHYGN